VGPDVDLDRRRDNQCGNREQDRDQRGGEELVPLAAAACYQPGGERQEESGQLGDCVREHAEEKDADRDVQLKGDRRALEAEVEGLGGEREEGDGADEENRQLPRLDVDPARRSASRRRR
jgi:hypothetical protein